MHASDAQLISPREVSTHDGKIFSSAQSDWLGVCLVFTVCYNEAYARKWPYQALPVCSHEHPSLVPKQCGKTCTHNEGSSHFIKYEYQVY